MITYREATVLKQNKRRVLLDIDGFGRKVIDVYPDTVAEIGKPFVAVMRGANVIGGSPDWLGKAES